MGDREPSEHRLPGPRVAPLTSWGPDPARVRDAAWVARCVGRGDQAPLRPGDLDALGDYLESTSPPAGSVLFRAGEPSRAVWILRAGSVELAVGSGRRRAVIAVMRPGDVDGDIPLLLDMPPPYTARTATDCHLLRLDAASFARLLDDRPAVTRRWMTSVAQRTAGGQARLIGLLGRTLPEQAAALLRDEDFEKRGLIAVGYREIRIRDARGLARITG